MMKKEFAWVKRCICIALAGTLILCSDNISYAAMSSGGLVSETQAETAATDTERTAAETVFGVTEETERETEKSTEVPTEVSTEETAEKSTEKSAENATEAAVEKSTEQTDAAEENVATEDVKESSDETAESETDSKSANVPSGLTLNAASKYREISLGEEITLPDYTIQYTDSDAAGTEASAEWSTDSSDIIALNKVTNKVTGMKAGIATLTLQVKDSSIAEKYYVIVAPAAPESVSQTGSSYDFVEMAWKQVNAAMGYTIYRKAESDTEYEAIAHVEGAGTTTYKDSNYVLIGRKYTYRIKSYTSYKDETGAVKYAESAGFAQLVVTPSLGRVTAQEAVADSYNSVVFRWNALDGAEGYTVYRATGSSADFTELASVGANELSYTDTTVVAGNSYHYKVSGYRMVNGTKTYGEASDIFTANPMPEAVTLNAVVKGTKSIKLSWNQVGGADGYAIYRKVSGQEAFKNIKTITDAAKAEYTDKSVQTGTKYVYQIRAYCNVNGGKVWGDYSNQITITPTIVAPTEISLTNTSYNSITLTWSKVSSAEGYKVLRATSLSGKYKTVATIKGKNTKTYTDKKLSVGKTYYYKVCGYTTVNGKKLNGAASEIKEGKAVAPATTVTSEAAGATAVKLTWTKVELPSKNSGYNIYQIENGQSTKIKSCKRTTVSYTVKNLQPGVNYTFKVVPYVKDSAGQSALGLDSNLLTTTPQLFAVTIEKGESTADGSIKLTWKATADAAEDTYVVYRAAKKKGTYSIVGSVEKQEGVSEYSFEDTAVSFGKKYYYKIMCTKTLADGTVMQSDASTAKAVNAAPAAPDLTVKSAGSESLLLTWKKVKISSGRYVEGYAIYRSSTEKGTYKKIKTINSGTTTKYTDTGLTTGNTYYYKIRAFYKSNGKTVYSADSAIVAKQVVPAKPEITVASVNYESVRISWKQVTGCSGYQIKRATEVNGTYKSVKTISSASTLSYDNSKLTMGTTYYYKVRAFIKKDGKKVYGEYSDVAAVVPTIGKPTDLAGSSIDNGQIKLTWTAVPGAQTYTVVRSTSATGSYKIATELCNTNSYTDTSVAAGTTYYYKVQAIRNSTASDFTDAIAVTAASIELSTTSVTMKTGTSIKITATVTPTAVVSWTSDNPKVAIVASDGTIYAQKEGTTTVNATANNMTQKVTVTVKDKLGTEDKGIEISSGNGTVDFSAIRAAGYEYVMLRISSGTTEDKNFKTNLKNAKAAGLKVGVYCYSKAQTKTAAANEAKKVISILNGETLDYPVVYDLEDISLLYNTVTKTDRVEFVSAFRSEILNAGKGYQFILGISQSLLTQYPEKYLDTSQLAGIDIWVYNCRTESLGHGYQGTGNVVMWRYTDSGTVSGISGTVKISNRYKTY